MQGSRRMTSKNSTKGAPEKGTAQAQTIKLVTQQEPNPSQATL